MSFDNFNNRGGNFCTTSGLLTATGAVTTHDATVSIGYAIDGKASLKAPIVAAATPTTDINTGVAFPILVGGGNLTPPVPGNGAVAVWGLTSGGTVVVAMGPATALDLQGNFLYAPQFPAIPDTMVPFAYQVLKAGATASATAIRFGASVWNAVGFTNVIQNVMALPSRPQVA